MTLDDARTILLEDGDATRIADAITAMILSPESSLDDLLLGLQHPGFTAEQAAFELHVRTGRPYPKDGALISTNANEWHEWITKHSRSASSIKS